MSETYYNSQSLWITLYLRVWLSCYVSSLILPIPSSPFLLLPPDLSLLPLTMILLLVSWLPHYSSLVFLPAPPLSLPIHSYPSSFLCLPLSPSPSHSWLFFLDRGYGSNKRISIWQLPDRSGSAWFQSGSRLINQAAAWFQSGGCLINQAVPDFKILRFPTIKLVVVIKHTRRPLSRIVALKKFRGSKRVSKSILLV